MLPVAPRSLKEAVTTVREFAVAYATWRYDEPSALYLQRLSPHATEGLRNELAKSIASPALVAQRTALRQISTGTVTEVTLRSLDPASLLFSVRIHQNVAPDGPFVHGYALWLRPVASRWLVAQLEPSGEDELSMVVS